jgi:uncharacterized membrane protein YeiH
VGEAAAGQASSVDRSLFANDAQLAFELVGIFAFALSGAMMAIRKEFDVIGIVLLAGLTALGGGVLRDVLIGDTPPVAFERLDYLLVPAVATLLAIVAHPSVHRLLRPLLVFDAAGLAVFSVSGTLKAFDAGLHPLPAALLGVVTGVGGGLLRDVVSREVPVLVRADSDLYAIPAAVGALAVAFLADAGQYSTAVGVGAALGVFGIRVAAMTFGWRAPGAWRRASRD